MNELVTLDRQHPDFMKYLWGTFSKDRRALPLKSLNIRTAQETVTFRLVPVKELSKPSWPVIWLKALRPRAFLQILIPMFLVLCLSESQGFLAHPDLPWLATFGMLFLFASLLFANDVQDHLSGVDRILPDRGSRAIQNGWLTASTLQGVSTLCLVIAALFAIPLFFAVPFALLMFLPAVLIGSWAFYRRSESFKDVWTGSLALFLLAGPLLAIGYQTALTEGFDLQGLALGFLWGWLVLFPMHMRSLSQLVAEGRAGSSRTLVGRLGFDRSVRLIQAWWIVGLFGFVGYHYLDRAPFWFWLFLFILVAFSTRFVKALRALKSPAGSAVDSVRRQGEFYFHALILLWVLEALWRMSP